MQQTILFACTMNAVRSPMAAALLGGMTGWAVESAGVRPGEPDLLAAAALAEIGLDMTHQPHRFEEMKLGRYDLIITLSPEAQHQALEMTRHLAVPVEYWPTQDPTAADGSREQRLAAYRLVRDDLRQKLQNRFASGT